MRPVFERGQSPDRICSPSGVDGKLLKDLFKIGIESKVFTGLVEEQGTVVRVDMDGGDARILTIKAEIVSSDATIGASIAINGCCLTIVAIDGWQLDFQAGAETLGRTNLGELNAGDHVNLERSIRAGDRLGGHYVSGHIDAVGQVEKRLDDDDWSEFWFTVPESLTTQMASKGSVAVDGVSLTLVNVTGNQFSVALIPHTLEETTLGRRHIGDRVNVETDIIAKYVQQQLVRQKVG